MADPRTQRRHRARARQCARCRALWSLVLVRHPAGPVAVCRHSGFSRAAVAPDLTVLR